MASAARRQRIVEIVSPYSPRIQFVPFHDRAARFAVIVAHRRAGKTVACVNELIKGAAQCELKAPRLAYIAPLFNQAKDVAWGYLREYTACIPGTEYNESELRADLPGGARIRLYGADNPDRLRGLYFDGVVLDEFGDMDPRVWSEVLRPTLSDRRGWAVFIGTPKGRNTFYELFRDADSEARPDWYRLMLKASETGLISADELADARQAMTEDQYAQEYECDFQAAVVGAYYGREMRQAEQDKRITAVPWEPQLQVFTAWDLGVGDSTVIWFAQIAGNQVRVIDYLENSGVGLDWYAKELDRKPYKYAEHILPHDVNVREIGAESAKSRLETLADLGLTHTRIISNQRIEDGINAARLMLPRCWFDANKCKIGLEALRQYRKEWDAERKVFNNRPLHNFASHAADAFRYLALANPVARDTKFHRKIEYPKEGLA